MTEEQKGVPYVTQRAHGNYPAGSMCRAWREDQLLVLEFEDGGRVELDDARYYLKGVDPEPCRVTVDELLAKAVSEEVAQAEDRRALSMMLEAAGG